MWILSGKYCKSSKKSIFLNPLLLELLTICDTNSRITHSIPLCFVSCFSEPGQQKSFKRKRSLINWPFWKGSNPQLDGLPLSPSLLSSAQGRLFGRPLSAVCSSDHGLPKPVMVSSWRRGHFTCRAYRRKFWVACVFEKRELSRFIQRFRVMENWLFLVFSCFLQDMLGFLYLEGPYTRGIFRRSASAKACRELRDILDSGAKDPDITHQSVFVIATILKVMLSTTHRSSPFCLFETKTTENLHDWCASKQTKVQTS